MALALALRAAGAFVYPHVDETINARIVGNMLRDGNPNPQFFNYPSLVLYVQAAVRIFVGNQPVDYFAVTRMVASMAATASVFVVYCTARKLLRSVAAALFAAAVTAVCPLHVDMSPMVTVDIFVAVFSACAMYFCVRLYESGRVKDYLLAGACVGLAAGSKYTGVVFFCGVLVAHVLHHEAWRQILSAAGKPVLSMLTMVVTFLVTTPYALFDSKTFFAHVAYEGNHYRVGHGACIIDFSCTRSWGRYADVLVSDYGLGLIFCILALLALVLALRSFRTGGVQYSFVGVGIRADTDYCCRILQGIFCKKHCWRHSRAGACRRGWGTSGGECRKKENWKVVAGASFDGGHLYCGGASVAAKGCGNCKKQKFGEYSPGACGVGA